MSLKASPCTASMVLLPIVNVFPYYILLNDSVGLLKLDFKIFSSPFPCFLFMCLFMEEKKSFFLVAENAKPQNTQLSPTLEFSEYLGYKN